MMRLDQQQKYIKERDELLTRFLKESMETRKMITVAKEEEQKKKKCFGLFISFVIVHFACILFSLKFSIHARIKMVHLLN